MTTCRHCHCDVLNSVEVVHRHCQMVADGICTRCEGNTADADPRTGRCPECDAELDRLDAEHAARIAAMPRHDRFPWRTR